MPLEELVLIDPRVMVLSTFNAELVVTTTLPPELVEDEVLIEVLALDTMSVSLKMLTNLPFVVMVPFRVIGA